MTRVYADMVGDLFHHGHVRFLERARKLGDVLVVGVHSDETVAGYKRAPVMTMAERIQVIAACQFVDEVIPDAPLRVTREWIEEHRLDLVVHGDDLDEDTVALMYRDPRDMGILTLAPYANGISSTAIMERVRRRKLLRGQVTAVAGAARGQTRAACTKEWADRLKPVPCHRF